MPEMNSQIIKATVGSEKGKTIRIEVTPLGGEQKVADIKPKLEEVADDIEAIVKALSGAIEKAKPKKATIEFGIEIGIESGQLTALIVKGSGKANLKISLEWS